MSRPRHGYDDSKTNSIRACYCADNKGELADVINDPIFSMFVSQDGQSRLMRGEDGL